MSEVHPRSDWAHAVRSKVTRDVAVALVELPQVQTAVQLGASAGLVVDRDMQGIPVRPLSCRMHHSLDASACEKTLEDPDAPVPVPEDFRAAVAPVLSGLNRGAKMALKKTGDLEYIAAIEILLEEEDAAERWLTGEDSLGRAHDAEVRAVVEAKSGGKAGI